jgi:hypothetical protein
MRLLQLFSVFTPSKIVCIVLKYSLMPFTLPEVILYFDYWYFLKDFEPYGFLYCKRIPVFVILMPVMVV